MEVKSKATQEYWCFNNQCV